MYPPACCGGLGKTELKQTKNYKSINLYFSRRVSSTRELIFVTKRYISLNGISIRANK